MLELQNVWFADVDLSSALGSIPMDGFDSSWSISFQLFSRDL